MELPNKDHSLLLPFQCCSFVGSRMDVRVLSIKDTKERRRKLGVMVMDSDQSSFINSSHTSNVCDILIIAQRRLTHII